MVIKIIIKKYALQLGNKAPSSCHGVDTSSSLWVQAVVKGQCQRARGAHSWLSICSVVGKSHASSLETF